jgi:DNA-binding transcriptional regulator YiaG
MTPADLRTARKSLGLTQSGLAKALRLSEKNGDRSVRIWEQDGNTVPGPVQVAVEMLLERKRHTQSDVKTPVANP